ncbi:MAG: monovalent cation/H+ antiporter subunit A [Bauldia sp.]|nr:monovalent cation/H+ antiporter subunit A [Bauldia sp.]
MPETYLILLLAVPFAGSLLTLVVPRNTRNAEALLSGGVATAALVLTILLYPAVADGGVVRVDIPWMPSLGLEIALRIDGFAWLFAVLITGVGLLVVIYARYYMSPKDPLARFFGFMLSFMGAMLGLVLSGNIIQLAIFWELTSISSFLLISYWYHRQQARDGARIALIVTGLGGFALLVGMLIIGHIVGSYDLDEVLASGDVIREHPLYVTALLLFLLGALTKSAQFPFHFWLPQAMAAPTPVSAYLHSATMVKAGVFLLVRFWPAMAGTPEWFWIVTTCGMTTLVLGAYAAIFQRDLKGLLAYSTISHLGLITALLGMGSPLAAVAAIFHIVNHATFKASLFMAAGIIDHETGTRDITRLSGLIRFMPVTATLAIVASAAMAGVPLLNGFISKEMFFAETAVTNANGFANWALPVFATLAGAFAVAYSIRVVHGVFFGPPPVDLDRVPHEPPALMRRPIELLVLACLVVGIVPAITIGPFLASAVHAVLGSETPYYSLSIWHGFNLPLLMSAIALGAGTLLYVVLYRIGGFRLDGPPLTRHIRGARIFERILTTVTVRWAQALSVFAASRRLQPQLFLLLVIAVGVTASPLVGGFGGLGEPQAADVAFGLVWTAGVICAAAAAYFAKYHRLVALVLLGGAGLATSITFVWFSAPDLAITQLLVEIVTTVLILLGLRWLPERLENMLPAREGTRVRTRRYRDFALAVVSGLGVALLVYAVMTRQPPEGIGRFFIENAYTQGGGTNVVNVMLVDFRGFDTLGEITVLGIVAVTIFALLRRFRPARESIGKPEQQRIQNAFDDRVAGRRAGDSITEYLLVPSAIMQWLFPVIAVFAAYLFIRGHDLPGGGFAAGITMSIAFLLQYMAGGVRWVEDRLRILPMIWIGMGIMIAVLTGLGAWLFDYPFLTSFHQYVEVPVIGRVPLATALFFDLGVFLVVVGATVLTLIAIAHQSVRAHRVRQAEPEPAPTTAPAGDGGGGEGQEAT